MISPVIEELKTKCSDLYSVYLQFLSLSLSQCLFELVTRGIREFFTQIRSFVDTMANNPSATNFTAGLIARIHEDDIKKFPIANKVAFRRYLLRSCAVVKDTIAEFQNYLSESQSCEEGLEIKDVEVECRGRDDADDGGDEDDDDDSDGIPTTYSSREEVSFARRCVELMILALDGLKFALTSTTTTADAISNLSAEADCAACDRWVERVAELSKALEGAVIDLGAELYPPLVLPEQMESLFTGEEDPEEEGVKELQGQPEEEVKEERKEKAEEEEEEVDLSTLVRRLRTAMHRLLNTLHGPTEGSPALDESLRASLAVLIERLQLQPAAS